MNNEIKIPEGIEKIDRDQFATYLDVTPKEQTMSFALLGIGVTDYGIDYNPQVDSEKWVCEKNARSDHSSNQKQGSVSQTTYKGDPCFEFVEAGRDKLNYITHILDIDRWKGKDGIYPADLSDGKVVITKYMGEKGVIEYDLYYEGDKTPGTVTFANGKPTFTPSANLETE
jgi:hypothetical protein